MVEIEFPADMDGYVGKPLGTSEWVQVTQAMIDAFAAATGDHQWIHVDAGRARMELPGGTTIAHGFLSLSLLPHLAATAYVVRQCSRALNYGSNRVRFTSPVPSGSHVRAHFILNASEPVEGGRRLVVDATLQVQGQERPALVAQTITLIYR